MIRPVRTLGANFGRVQPTHAPEDCDAGHKIGSGHQITIPREVLGTLELEPGGVLEIVTQKGMAV